MEYAHFVNRIFEKTEKNNEKNDSFFNVDILCEKRLKGFVCLVDKLKVKCYTYK